MPSLDHVAEEGPNERCAVCGRATTRYGGVLQHRRGGQGTPRRLAMPEAAIVEILVLQRSMAVELAALRSELAAFTVRQPLILEVRPSHRRAADGGTGGRAELGELVTTRSHRRKASA